MPRKKVLIAGASGLVGFAAIRHFSQRDDWDVVAVSRRVPLGIERYPSTFIPVDLLDRQRCAEIFSSMSDVTHLVYAAVNEKPGDLVRGWRDREQMQTNLTMMRNLFEPLSGAAKNLRTCFVSAGDQGLRSASARPAPADAVSGALPAPSA